MKEARKEYKNYGTFRVTTESDYDKRSSILFHRK